MKIIVYTDRNKLNERINTALNSIIYSFKNNKNVKILSHKDKPEKCDICILWGIYCIHKRNTLYRKKIFDFQKKNGNKIIVIELGFLKRDYYYSLGYNSIVGFGEYNNNNSPSDRWNKLNITLKPNKINKKGYILLCGQIPWDTQLQHINYKKWLCNIVKNIKKYTNRTIIFRPHPKQSKKNELAITKLKGTKQSKNLNIQDDFKGAFAVIAFNSNALLDALLEGLPIYCFDKGSVVYNLANNDIKEIENPKFPNHDNKMQTLYNIAYMQWTKEELESGEAIQHLLN